MATLILNADESIESIMSVEGNGVIEINDIDVIIRRVGKKNEVLKGPFKDEQCD